MQLAAPSHNLAAVIFGVPDNGDMAVSPPILDDRTIDRNQFVSILRIAVVRGDHTARHDAYDYRSKNGKREHFCTNTEPA